MDLFNRMGRTLQAHDILPDEHEARLHKLEHPDP